MKTKYSISIRENISNKYLKTTSHLKRRIPILFLFLLIIGGLLNAQWVQVGQDINGSNNADWMGYAVDITPDGQRVVVTVPGNYYSQSMRGYAQVYENNNGNWYQLGDDILGEYWNDHFGISTSISQDGNRVAIGSVHNDDGAGESSGHVRVYDYDAGNDTWIQVGQDLDGVAAEDYFGTAISLDGSGMRIAIGGDGNDGNGNESGHLRVFHYDVMNDIWIQVGQTIEGEAAGDWFGKVSFSTDGSRLATGAPRNDGMNGVNSGHVRVYDYNPVSTTWVQVGQDIDGEAAYDESSAWDGWGLSLSGDGSRVAIGAHRNEGNGTFSGHVRVYDYDLVDTTWSQVGQDINGAAAGDLFGHSVTLSDDGHRIAAGAIGNDGNGNWSGHVRIYEYDGLSWDQVGGDIDGFTANDELGRAVALSSNGTRLVVGATKSDDGAMDGGQVRVYDYLECIDNPYVLSDDFETGFGNWNDGGNDCDRVVENANSGVFSIRLRDKDHNGSNSSMFTNDLDMTGFNTATVYFSYYPVNIQNGRTFLFEISTDGGNNYSVYKEYTSGTHFQNDTRHNEALSINGVAFNSTTRFRFRCNARNNNEKIFIDDVVIEACTSGCIEGNPCEDGDVCTTGETYDSSCDCLGGVYTDNDEDGYCIGEDPNDNDPCDPDFNHPNCTPQGNVLHVHDIAMNAQTMGPNWRAVANVTIRDELGGDVSAATVNGSWSELVTGNGDAATNQQGIAKFNSPKTDKTGWIKFTVTGVTKDGWTYDATANTETVDSVFGPPGAAAMVSYGILASPAEVLHIYPNPFSDQTGIHFRNTENGIVVLEVCNINGQKVRTVCSEYLEPGTYKYQWDGMNNSGTALIDGIYIVRLQTGDRTTAQRVCLVR